VPDPRWLVKRGHSSTIEGRCAAFVHLWELGQKGFPNPKAAFAFSLASPCQAMTHAMPCYSQSLARQPLCTMTGCHRWGNIIEHSITLQYMKISSTDYYHSMAPLSLSHDSPVIASFLARPITCSSQGQRRCDSSRFV
jgi:hypothetical protein